MKTHAAYIQEQMAKDPGFAARMRESDAEVDLALQLAHLRESLHLTQQDVARAAGMAQPAVARYEKAGRTPTVVALWRFADALNANIVIEPGFRSRVLARVPRVDETDITHTTRTTAEIHAHSTPPATADQDGAGSDRADAHAEDASAAAFIVPVGDAFRPLSSAAASATLQPLDVRSSYESVA